MSKNIDETVHLQSEKREEWIREIRGERLQGIAEGTSSAPCLTSSSAMLFPGRNDIVTQTQEKRYSNDIGDTL